MAKLVSGIQFIGTIGNLSAFTMRGTEGIVLRTKGGASRERIRTSPSFEMVRRNNAEFSGRATASKWIMKMMLPQKALAPLQYRWSAQCIIKTHPGTRHNERVR